MKLFFHFSYTSFSNTYILGPEEPGNAVLIDPGVMDIQLLDLIERNGYYVRHILITHDHKGHIQGIPTLNKIYDAEIYSGSDTIMNFASIKIAHGDRLDLSGISVDVIGLPGHTGASLAYKVHDLVFAGDALAAGTLGYTIHDSAHSKNIMGIRNHLLSLPDHVIIFPGHGPPTTVKAEKAFNEKIREENLSPDAAGKSG